MIRLLLSSVFKQKLLVLILILAFFIRVYRVINLPPSLNWDEVSHGYNAYSVLKTGADEWGHLLPLTNFRAYGDYPLPLNIYLTIPFIIALGLSEFSIRLPHVILGVATVLASYFLGFGFTKNRKISALMAFFVAIDPWFVFTSRFVAQSNLSIFLLVASAAAFFNREKSKLLLPFSVFLLGLTLYSYHTTRIFSPLFFLSILFIYRSEFIKELRSKKSNYIITAFIAFLFFVPLLITLIKPESRARSKEVFLIDSGAIYSIIEKRNNSTLPKVITRILYNRPNYFVVNFTKNYLGYFSPKYLFFQGGTQYQFSIPGRGLLYLVNLPLFYFGLIYLVYQFMKKDKNYTLLLLWLVIAPIPASITKESFAVLRSSAILPVPQLLIGIMFYKFLIYLTKYSKLKPLFIGSYITLLLWGMLSYYKDYFNNYAQEYSQDWQYGYKEAVNYSKTSYNYVDKIIVTKKYGEAHEFFLFYWQWDPEKYRNDRNLVRFYQSNWYWVDRFDKFYFVNDWEIPKEEWQPFVLESKREEIYCKNIKCLLITSPGNVPKGWNELQVIYFLNGKPAFEIYSNI